MITAAVLAVSEPLIRRKAASTTAARESSTAPCRFLGDRLEFWIPAHGRVICMREISPTQPTGSGDPQSLATPYLV